MLLSLSFSIGADQYNVARELSFGYSHNKTDKVLHGFLRKHLKSVRDKSNTNIYEYYQHFAENQKHS